MNKYIIIWTYHDKHIEFYQSIDECRKNYWNLIQEYRNNSDFYIKVYELKHEIEFL